MIPKDADIPFLDDRIETLTPGEIGQLADAVFTSKQA